MAVLSAQVWGRSGNRRRQALCTDSLPLCNAFCRQKGLYRISGCDKTVRELKEKFLRSKNIPLLSHVDDIHAICGLLKDFLRNLKEPLLTFRLNKTFMEAAGKETESDTHIFQRLNDRFISHVSWQTLLLLLQLCCGYSGCWGEIPK